MAKDQPESGTRLKAVEIHDNTVIMARSELFTENTLDPVVPG